MVVAKSVITSSKTLTDLNKLWTNKNIQPSRFPIELLLKDRQV